ncbi:MAG TPA: restriction endonuclease PLD domain-containing protein, partial [Sphingomicrobium sp.]|nr:restriction endonuclease PLD domain-containing protein [Sphingomicrobium sp.]
TSSAFPFNMPLSLSKPSTFGYIDVLKAWPNADRVTVVTWSIDADEASELLKALRDLRPETKLTLITNLPNRFRYYKTEYARANAAESITQYLRALAPKNFRCEANVHFCFTSHAKIVTCDSVGYVGSANFTTPSKGKFESGYLTRDRTELAEIESFVDRIKLASIPYFDLQNSKDLQQIVVLISRLPDLVEDVKDACYDYSYNALSDDYDAAFDFEKFAIPESVIVHLTKLAIACEAAENRGEADDASAAESCFADHYPSRACRELVTEVERINSREWLPQPINESALDSSLRRDLSYLETDGNADEISDSDEYKERWNDAIEENEKERVGTAERQIKNLIRDLIGLRATVQEAFHVNPAIDNASKKKSGK